MVAGFFAGGLVAGLFTDAVADDAAGVDSADLAVDVSNLRADTGRADAGDLAANAAAYLATAAGVEAVLGVVAVGVSVTEMMLRV